MRFAALLLLVIAMTCHADTELRVSFLSDTLTDSSELGAVEIVGVGAVKLSAQKFGNQIVVYAHGPDGAIIGRAESVVGLRDTPIYVATSQGLEKITIYWGTE